MEVWGGVFVVDRGGRRSGNGERGRRKRRPQGPFLAGSGRVRLRSPVDAAAAPSTTHRQYRAGKSSSPRPGIAQQQTSGGRGAPKTPGRRRPGLAACGQSHAAFPSQKGWWSGNPAPRPFRSGVSARLTPRFGNPSPKGCGPGNPAPRPFRSGTSARLTPRFGNPSPMGCGSGSPAPRPFRSGVSARLTPRFGNPSPMGCRAGGPAPRPFRSGTSAVLPPRYGNDRRCIRLNRPPPGGLAGLGTHVTLSTGC